MKIEGKRPGFDQPLDRVESNKTPGAGPDRARGISSVDHLRVSAEARLAREAVQLAQAASGVRPEAVERAKALLASGELGADVDAVAEAIIDAVLEE